MPNKAKNLRGGASNIKLHAGGGIRFGFMRQNNLSGRTLSVTDVSSYLFDSDSFASYQLRDEDTDVNMILAEGERPQDSYLALSLPLKDKWFSSLFAALPPKQWLKLKADDKVTVSADKVIMPQGWLLNNYRHVLTTKGRKVDGDYRQSRHSELAEFYSDPFDYVLLVSETGEHAIELEKYENGSMKIYATVYRPVSDISESTQFHRPYIVANNTVEAIQAKPEEVAAQEVMQETVKESAPKTVKYQDVLKPLKPVKEVNPEAAAPQVPPTLTLVPTAKTIDGQSVEVKAAEEAQATTVVAKPPSESTVAELVQTALAETEKKETAVDPNSPITSMMLREEEIATTQTKGKTEAVKPAETAAPASLATAPSPANLLSCDVTLASNLIEEARRNKLSMADVIRKVIDLPRKIDDRVYVPFDLTDEEQVALAKRYGLKQGDTDAVQKKIVEELRQFAGIDG